MQKREANNKGVNKPTRTKTRTVEKKSGLKNALKNLFNWIYERVKPIGDFICTPAIWQNLRKAGNQFKHNLQQNAYDIAISSEEDHIKRLKLRIEKHGDAAQFKLENGYDKIKSKVSRLVG